VHVIRNGHSQIKQALGKNAAAGFIAAVEESAHYYLNLRQNRYCSSLSVTNCRLAAPA